MKINKSLFIFFGIFIFMIIPKNVYAADIYSISAGGVDLTGSNNTLYYDGFSSSYTFPVHVVDYGVHNYYILYASLGNASTLNASLSGGCNVSCFGNSVFVQQIGLENNTYPIFAIILSEGKTDCGVGSGVCLIDNNLTLSSSNNFYLNIIGAVAQDENPLLSNNYQNLDSIINNQNRNTQDIIGNNNYNTNNIINNQNQNWNNFNNSDLSNQDKESPDTSQYNDYQTAENNLFDKMQQADTNNLNVAIDSNSATWVWNRITEWLNCHALLMSFLVSMLSIGIIKMALGR